jgi:hypothetical protein
VTDPTPPPPPAAVALQQREHERRQDAEPGHDLSSCWCCCLTCGPDAAEFARRAPNDGVHTLRDVAGGWR